MKNISPTNFSPETCPPKLQRRWRRKDAKEAQRIENAFAGSFASLRLCGEKVNRTFLVAAICVLALAVHGQDKEEIKSINGTRLFIKTIGKGEPILVVHGGPGMNHSYFMPHLKDLSKNYKVVYYDQRASGKSALSSPDSLSLKFFVDDIEAIRKELGADKLNILAHSWGAILAVNYALRYPDKVKKMILSNPVPLSKEFDAEMLANQQRVASYRDSTDRSLIIGSRDFKEGKADAYRKLLLLSFRHSFYDPANHSKLHVEVPSNYAVASKALYEGLGKDLADYNWYGDIKSFAFPTLILQGKSDAIPLAASTKLQASIPNSSLEVFQKSGHFNFIEQRKKFNGTVAEFFK